MPTQRGFELNFRKTQTSYENILWHIFHLSLNEELLPVYCYIYSVKIHARTKNAIILIQLPFVILFLFFYSAHFNQIISLL